VVSVDNNNNGNPMIKITGLWKATDKNGNTYIRGNFSNSTQVLIMKNNFKNSDNEPDYNLFLVPKKRKTESNLQDQQQEDNIPF
jgi:hypothetical protein